MYPSKFLASLTIVGQSQMAFSQQPISKGDWSYKNGKPESVTFDHGTELTAEEIELAFLVGSIAFSLVPLFVSIRVCGFLNRHLGSDAPKL